MRTRSYRPRWQLLAGVLACIGSVACESLGTESGQGAEAQPSTAPASWLRLDDKLAWEYPQPEATTRPVASIRVESEACEGGPSACAPPAAAPDCDPDDLVPCGEDAEELPEIPWATAMVKAEEAAERERWKVYPATQDDLRYPDDEPIDALHLIYRVRLRVPKRFAERGVSLGVPAGELYVQVSSDRLRARFSGPGWPVPTESEVRLRADVPGVYVFDGESGRPLPAGRLSGWYEGRGHGRYHSNVGIHYDTGTGAEGATALLCGLLAEWGSLDRDGLIHRCRQYGPPPSFNVGSWRAELTAVVPMEVAARALRADHVDPPERVGPANGGAWLTTTELARLRPRPAAEVAASGDAPPPTTTAHIDVTNEGRETALIIVGGIPVGWVAAGASYRFEGFLPGRYRVGAMRPSAILSMIPTLVTFPGALRIERELAIADHSSTPAAL